MKSFLTLISLLVLAAASPRAHAGNVNFLNLSSYTYAGYLIGSNVWPGATYSSSYEQYIEVPPSGGTLFFSDPTALPSPSPLGVPPATPVASGVFIGVKGYCIGIPSNNGAVGRPGNFMVYPASQSNPPYYSVQFNPSGNDAFVLIMP